MVEILGKFPRHHPAWTRPLDDPHRPRWIPNEHAFPALGSLTLAEEKRSERVIPGGGPVVVERNSTVDLAVRSERNKGLQAPLGRNVGTSRRGMFSTKPRKQSALKIYLDGTPMEEIVVLEEILVLQFSKRIVLDIIVIYLVM